MLVERFQPGSFRSSSPDAALGGPEFTFPSFVTLTSVGYGDILPASGFARSLASLEAVAGQVYLAIFVARLVGLAGPRKETG